MITFDVVPRLLLQYAVAFLAIALGVSVPVAQERRVAQTIPNRVTLVLVDSLQVPDVKAVIVRRADASMPDVIVLRRSTASAEHLLDAYFMMALLRGPGIPSPTSDEIIRVVRHRGAAPFYARHRERAQRDIARLVEADRRAVPGGGDGPTIHVTLPAEPIRTRAAVPKR